MKNLVYPPSGGGEFGLPPAPGVENSVYPPYRGGEFGLPPSRGGEFGLPPLAKNPGGMVARICEQ